MSSKIRTQYTGSNIQFYSFIWWDITAYFTVILWRPSWQYYAAISTFFGNVRHSVAPSLENQQSWRKYLYVINNPFSIILSDTSLRMHTVFYILVFPFSALANRFLKSMWYCSDFWEFCWMKLSLPINK